MHTLKTSILIRDGLAYLWDGTNISDARENHKEEYLCHAIIRAARGGELNWMLPKHRAEIIVEVRVRAVKTMIEGRLLPYNNLYAWLRHQVGIPDAHLTSENLQRHRKQWAKRLIAEFKRKGD